MRRAAAPIFLACLASLALAVAGCGGGSSSPSTTAPQRAPGRQHEGAPKKATAPNAPPGSRVVACKVGTTAMRGLRATAVDCGSARTTMRRWARERACALHGGASRGSCSLAGFRCQAVRTGNGTTVSCARPGGDVTFVARRR